jgi:hypothetical protein
MRVDAWWFAPPTFDGVGVLQLAVGLLQVPRRLETSVYLDGMDGEDEPSDGEVFRFCRGGDVRSYRLRVVCGGVELWRFTVRSGTPEISIMEEHFNSADVAVQYFGEIERTLRAGGWRPVPRD